MKISRLEIKSESFDIIHHATTSKGNQAKYTDGEIWIKTNYLGYEDLAEYLSNILAFDAVVMNEDRHIYNLAIIYCEKTDTYRTCPIFDNGLSLMSDTHHYPEYTSPMINMRRIKCKPFNTSFKKQFEVCIPTIRFDKQQVMALLETINNERINKIIRKGMQDYSILFV